MVVPQSRTATFTPRLRAVILSALAMAEALCILPAQAPAAPGLDY
jgi:hypothetical protein